ncbi:hypothetical protein ACNKHX_15415 [Shigella flexneri]
MTRRDRLVTVREGAREEVVGLMQKRRIEKVLVITPTSNSRA